jgi:hypothetical protein
MRRRGRRGASHRKRSGGETSSVLRGDAGGRFGRNALQIGHRLTGHDNVRWLVPFRRSRAEHGGIGLQSASPVTAPWSTPTSPRATSRSAFRLAKAKIAASGSRRVGWSPAAGLMRGCRGDRAKIRSLSSSAFPTVTIPRTPAVWARARTSGRSFADSGAVRCAWTSTSSAGHRLARADP